MTYCPNCGRELADGEVCNCIPQPEEVNAPAENTAEITNEAPIEAPAAPAEAPQPTYCPPQQQYAPQPETYYVPPVGAYAPPQSTQQPVPADAPARTDFPEGYKIKKKLVAVVLAVTVGMFGIHNYYLGNNSKALAQLLVCLLGSLLFGLGAIVAYVWAIVEAILIFSEKEDKDANGYKILTPEESIARAINESK